MTLLIVDDQRIVIDSLLNGIDFAGLGFSQVRTATSAIEAKLILVNYEVDVLLTDIEMPNENGISLFHWAREKYPMLVAVFLTSHANFEYVQAVLRDGGLDYILQPARFEDIECALRRAIEESQKRTKTVKMEQENRFLMDQQDALVDLLLAQYRKADYEGGLITYAKIQEILNFQREENCCYLVWISVLLDRQDAVRQDGQIMKFVLKNMLEEILKTKEARVLVGKDAAGEYLAMIFMEKEEGGEELLRGYRLFQSFMEKNTKYQVMLYPILARTQGLLIEGLQKIEQIRKEQERRPGVYYETKAEKLFSEESNDAEERVIKAQNYVKNHMELNPSRKEVADILHINEDYFSRIFRKYTGYGFKDYVIFVKIKEAKKLLAHSRLSISVIASKLGYDNFAYFSTVFKKEVGMSPQEYRKQMAEKSENR